MGPLRAGRVLKGGAVEHVQRLRREPGRGLMVWGSISLAQSLLKAGLVDEIQQGDGALAALGRAAGGSHVRQPAEPLGSIGTRDDQA